jgi:hypothetical protein
VEGFFFVLSITCQVSKVLMLQRMIKHLDGYTVDGRMINECGAVGGMRIGWGNKYSVKTHSVPICPPKI